MLPADALVAQLNDQFANGSPSNDISRAGVLVHTFDNTENDVTAKQSMGLSANEAEPWRPCSSQAWCGQFHGRFSATIINRRQRVIFTSQTSAGIVLSPATAIYCSYPVDGGTMQKFCPEGSPPDCAAGCATPEGQPNWCGHEAAWSGLMSAPVWDCAFRPSDLGGMLQHHLNSRADQYNEVVVDTRNYEANLPEALLAFFFVEQGSGGASEFKARDAHSHFMRKYPHARTALVALDVNRGSAAFRQVL